MKFIKNLLYVAVVLASTSLGCKKDNTNDPQNSSKNSYNYLDVNRKITTATYFTMNRVGENILSITLKGEGTSKWVQLFLYNAGGIIPTGALAYKNNVDPSYNPAINFSGGSVNLDIATADVINNGRIVISKNGDEYTINVDCSTKKGTLKGFYYGKIVRE